MYLDAILNKSEYSRKNQNVKRNFEFWKNNHGVVGHGGRVSKWEERTERLGGFGVGGVDDYLAVRAEADAFGADTGKGLHGEVDDAAVAGVHGIEFKGLTGGLDAFGGGTGHHFEFLEAQGAIAGAVQKDFVLEGRLETERAMGEMLDGLEELGAAFEEQAVIATGEFGEDLGAAIVRSGA